MQFPKEAIKPLLVVFLFVLALVLSGCGGHSAPAVQFTQPGPPAYLTVAVNPSSVLPGQSATITWSSQNAASCTASGAWTGAQPTSGSANVTLQASSAQAYTLVCTGAGQSATQTVTLAVSPAEGACAVNSAVKAHTHLGKRSTLRRRAAGSPS
jgi:hypothetical protein